MKTKISIAKVELDAGRYDLVLRAVLLGLRKVV